MPSRRHQRLARTHPWSTSPAAAITYRLALVATVTAAVFEAFLLRLPGMLLGDHVIIGSLIAGMLVATIWRGSARRTSPAGR
jgi:hypothetical protein